MKDWTGLIRIPPNESIIADAFKNYDILLYGLSATVCAQLRFLLFLSSGIAAMEVVSSMSTGEKYRTSLALA